MVPIAVVGYTPIVLVVNPKVPATNAKEFVAWLKSLTGPLPAAYIAAPTLPPSASIFASPPASSPM